MVFFLLLMLAMVALAFVRIQALPWQLGYLALHIAVSLALYLWALDANPYEERAQVAFSIAFVPGMLAALGRLAWVAGREARARR